MELKIIFCMHKWVDLDFFTRRLDRPILDFLTDQRKQKLILPAENDVFNALTYTPWDQVKVVILGQDPYPNPEHAHGLAFSVPESCKNLPMSLRNILKELKDDLGIDHPNGNLAGWARQGVLLLNTVLTVEAGNSNSHKKIGWSILIQEILQKLNEEKDHLVFILWGGPAQKLGKKIDRSRHVVIEGVHPSPLSSYRGFFGSRPFSKTNHALEKFKLTPIDWSR
jgi:uracil-DNA glycosylase